MIRNKLKHANISLSFEALAMAESAFRFNAKSPAGARGLWQYMPASARHYGLHISHKLDERTDPALSTDAAIKYLKFLNKKFGKISVLLSIAAYNAGEGRIAGVVRRSGIKSGKRGYSRIIRFLPKETRGYVPEFLAAALILKNPSYFGFPVQKKQPHRYVQLRQSQSIKKIAQLSLLPIKKIRQLNPELKKYSSTPSNNFIIRLPTKAAARLKNKLASKAILWKSYTKPISLALSASVGKQKKNSSRKPQVVYQVRKGNHLGGIAKMFGVPIRDLRKKNQIHKNQIQVGQLLIIPIKKQLNKKTYRVKAGDNLGLIAQRLGVSIQHLKFVNGVINPRRLRLGQKLVYYV
jgi:membrane-bound lytic murein transglycosylase D